MTPASGPPGVEIAIGGQNFVPYAQYTFYWEIPRTLIDTRLADDIGQLQAFTFTVPISATPGTNYVLADRNGTVVVRSPFEVTSP